MNFFSYEGHDGPCIYCILLISRYVIDKCVLGIISTYLSSNSLNFNGAKMTLFLSSGASRTYPIKVNPGRSHTIEQCLKKNHLMQN